MFLYDGKYNFMEEALMNLTHGSILSHSSPDDSRMKPRLKIKINSVLKIEWNISRQKWKQKDISKTIVTLKFTNW